jgi:hypothetical protein
MRSLQINLSKLSGKRSMKMLRARLSSVKKTRSLWFQSMQRLAKQVEGTVDRRASIVYDVDPNLV